jgi:hypothetical protein
MQLIPGWRDSALEYGFLTVALAFKPALFDLRSSGSSTHRMPKELTFIRNKRKPLDRGLLEPATQGVNVFPA